MNHLSHQQLSALLDDALAPAERATCDAHLASCEACRAELAELGSLERDLGTALGHDPGEAYFATFADRVAERIAQGGKAAPAAVARRRSLWAWLLSPRGLSLAGGMAALLVTAGVAWMRFRAQDDVAGAFRAAAPSPSRSAVHDEANAPPAADRANPPADARAAAPREQATRPPAAGAAPPQHQREVAPRADAEATRARKVTTLANGESVPVPQPAMQSQGVQQNTTPAREPAPVMAEIKRQALERAGEAPAPAATPVPTAKSEERTSWGTKKQLFATPPPPATPPATLPPAATPAPAEEKDAFAPGAAAGSLEKSSRGLDKLQVRQEGEQASQTAVAEPVPLAIQCGTVRDTRGAPVKGAQIMLLGAIPRSARSAPDGSFCLSHAVEGDTLVLMHVGFEPLRIVLTRTSSLAIGLEPVGTLGPRDGLLMGTRSDAGWRQPPAAAGGAPVADVYASETPAVRVAVAQAREHTAIARRERGAEAWETAADRWDGVAAGLAGRAGLARPAFYDARFQSLAAVREAWRVAVTPERARRFRAVLVEFLASAPRTLPERATAARWQAELERRAPR